MSVPESSPTEPRADAAAVADRLHSAAIRLLRRLRKQDAVSGLSGPQASALSVLVFGGPMNLGALAAAEQVRPPTMSRLVKEMEALALVWRRPDPADARGVILEATEKGRAMFDRAREQRLSTLTGAVRALAPQEQRTLDAAARLVLALARGPALD
jgi:DNA-binding MarR family transcriptional regulator